MGDRKHEEQVAYQRCLSYKVTATRPSLRARATTQPYLARSVTMVHATQPGLGQDRRLSKDSMFSILNLETQSWISKLNLESWNLEILNREIQCWVSTLDVNLELEGWVLKFKVGSWNLKLKINREFQDSTLPSDFQTWKSLLNGDFLVCWSRAQGPS